MSFDGCQVPSPKDHTVYLAAWESSGISSLHFTVSNISLATRTQHLRGFRPRACCVDKIPRSVQRDPLRWPWEMPHIIDLGHNLFNVQKSGLHLVSNASAAFEFSDSASPSSISISLEQSLASRDVWVVQGPAFTLEICIQAHCSHTVDMPIFLKLAGELLVNAKVCL